MYHASRGKTRKYLRWADHTMIATATMVGLIDEQFSYVKLYEFSNSRKKKKILVHSTVYFSYAHAIEVLDCMSYDLETYSLM